MKQLKLKVNDVCKVIANRSHHEFEIGEVVTITKCYPSEDHPHYKCNNENDFWWLNDEELELIK